jgi:flagellar L-ring protein precursor FlgH
VRNRKYFILNLAFIFLVGCTTTPTGAPDFSDSENLQVPEFSGYVPPQTAEGSLWSEMTGLNLYPDMRARKTGDVVVIRIVEDPEANLNADTTASRSSSIEAQLEFFGIMQQLADKYPYLPQKAGVDDLIKANLNSQFKGEGSSNRDGHIRAYISALVVKVFSNGNLYVKGKREIRVNNETQYITIAGIIRPEDIGPYNEISSTYVADAQIIYSGIGVLADKQKPGWLGRVVDHVWPF